MFSYLTVRQVESHANLLAALDLGPLAGALATLDFLALAATCSAAWAIYSAGREQLWRAALGHRLKVSGALNPNPNPNPNPNSNPNPNQVSGGPADRDWRALHRLLCGTLEDGIEARGWADSSELENAAEVCDA